MKIGTVRLAMLAAVTCALLAGCSDPTPPGAGTTADAPATTGTTGGQQPTGSPATSGSASPAPSPSSAASPSFTSSSTPTSSATPTRSSTPTSTGDGDEQPGLEMPVAPEPGLTSLSHLLAATNNAPLVRAPLPRSASAVGRIVPAFPALLRPSRASLVDSSSISSAGDRLQAGLVASTSLAPQDVLLAYRTRFTRRGLSEQALPATAPGSVAAAFRRGPSAITVTVTDEGSRTSYSLHATLHTGGG